MGVIKGLAAINNMLDEQKKRADEAANRVKVRWLKLDDGQSIKVRFVEEIDEDSSGYDDDRGLAVVISEHSNPDNFRLKAACTQDTEGKCWACQKAQDDRRWRAKNRYYTNVIVDNGQDAPFVAVWSQSVSTRSAFNILREYAMDMGAITTLTWKLKRNGLGTETSYVLMPMGADAEPFDWSKFEPFNLEKIVREVPYSEQEDFYTESDVANVAGEPVTSANINW